MNKDIEKFIKQSEENVWNFNKKHIAQALKCYTEALDIAQKHFKPDNIAKIEIRINDIKMRIGENEYEKLKAEINW